MTLPLNKTLFSCVLFFATALLYANTLSHGFVWDDHYLIENNPQIKEFRLIPDYFTKDLWKNTPVNFESGFYRPLVLLSFFTNEKLWHGQAFGFHLFNILLHAINGVLVFHFISLITKNIPMSFFSAAIFIIHPVQTEAVNFIANVGDLLVVTFFLLSLQQYIKFLKNDRTNHQAAYLCFFALALLSKESAMAGLGLFIVLDWLYFSGPHQAKTRQKVPPWVWAFVVLGFYLALRLMILGLDNTLTTLGSVRYVSILPAFDLWSHILTSAKITCLYLGLLAFPGELTISHVVLPVVSLRSAEIFSSVICLMALGGLIVACARNDKKHVAFGLTWFFICILPVSNIIPISNTIAERFLYLPSIGFCLLAGCGLERLWSAAGQKSPISRRAVFLLCCVIFILLGARTLTRSAQWRSDFTLFSSAVGGQPCAPVAHLNLSAYYNQNGDFQNGNLEEQRYHACLEAIQSEYQHLKGRAGK